MTQSDQAPKISDAGRTLIIGSFGFIGQFITQANLQADRPTYLLIRPGPSSPCRDSAINSLRRKGASIIYGSIDNQIFMTKVIRDHKIEYVISAVGGGAIMDQIDLVKAIKAVGTVKRFLPSEFGHDMDRANPVEPGMTMYNEKRKVRRAIEEAGIPYTYVCCNSIAAWPYHDNTHPADVLPPLDRFQIYGDGSVKAYFVAGTDIGKFTIKCVDDARTINKVVHFRPPTNLFSVNELAALWEDKIGCKLPRVTVTENDLLAAAGEMRIPESIVAAITHDIFIKGCQINYSMDKPTDLEVCSLYPDTPFRTINDCFNDFVQKMAENPNPKLVEVDMPTSNNGIMVPNTKQGAVIITA